MLLPLLLLYFGGTDPTLVYNGRSGSLDVHPPRLDLAVKVDGVLDEPAWRQAALLTGFSQFSPLDGVARDGLHRGARLVLADGDLLRHPRLRGARPGARDAGRPRQHRRRRQRPDLPRAPSTTGARRWCSASTRSGVQMDGTLGETGATSGGGSGTARSLRREAADLSPDFVFESKGRLTRYGYEVEIRIPFKSLSYQPRRTSSSWGDQRDPRGAALGLEDTWAPARRAARRSSSQAGTLDGLHRPAPRAGARPQSRRSRSATGDRTPRRPARLELRAAAARSSAATCAGASPTT